ncbi:LicD family protein [Paraglaciecola aestuariivivens]
MQANNLRVSHSSSVLHSQNQVTNSLKGINISSLDTEQPCELTPHEYKAADNHINLIQQGLRVKGQCKIDPEHQATLVATAGKRVIASFHFPAKSTAANEDEPAVANSINFSIRLDINTLRPHSAESMVFMLFNKTQRTLLEIPVCDFIRHALGSEFDIRNIAPSYGFFGGGKNQPLKVDVEQVLQSLTFSVEQDAGYLNIAGIKLFDENNQLISVEKMSVSCSSSHNPDPHSTKVVLGQGFHSKRENTPWLTVSFASLQFVKRIEVVNRRDKWGNRAQKLRITSLDKNAKESELYAPFSSLNIAKFLLTTLDILEVKNIGISDLQMLCEKPVDLLLAALEKAPLDKKLAFFALNFISVWAAKAPELAKLNKELKVLAYYVFAYTQVRLKCSLLAFERLLAFSDNVEVLEAELNILREKHQQPLLKFTKHGLAQQGMLVQNVPEVLHTLKTVMADLTELGLRPCLAYGTLLGAHRNQAFIPHDDDVDILIEFSEPELNRDKVIALRDKLIAQFDKSKYRISTDKVMSNLNIHLILRETNIMIDVFPYWNNADNAMLHMEKMKIRGIPKAILADRKPIQLAGENFMAPADVEGFLQQRYGETWHVSDKFHEWPWPIKTSEGV